jgi:hypothetical protein
VVVPLLVACVLSPLYVPVIVWVPLTGLYPTEQLAEVPPPESVQLRALKRPLAAVLEKPTVPVGVVIVPSDVSVTVAVHLSPAGLACTQLTVVVVARLATVTVVLPLLLAWVLSPP